MLSGLFQRVNAAAATKRDAEAGYLFIHGAVRAAPHSPYVLAQTVLVQQQALEAAANCISELEAAARKAPEQTEEQGGFLGNLGKSIFGPGPSSPPPRLYLARRPTSAASASARLRAARASRRLSLRKAIRSNLAAIRRSPAPGASPSLRPAAEASYRTQPRPRRAWRAAWSSASAGRPIWRPRRRRGRSLWRAAPPGLALPALRGNPTRSPRSTTITATSLATAATPTSSSFSRRAGRPRRQFRQPRRFGVR